MMRRGWFQAGVAQKRQIGVRVGVAGGEEFLAVEDRIRACDEAHDLGLA